MTPMPILAGGASTCFGPNLAAVEAGLGRREVVLRRRRDLIGADFKPQLCAFRDDVDLDQGCLPRMMTLAKEALTDLAPNVPADLGVSGGMDIVVALPEPDPSQGLTQSDLETLGTDIAEMAAGMLGATTRHTDLRQGGASGHGAAIALDIQSAWDGTPVLLIGVDSWADRGRILAAGRRRDLFSSATPYGLIPGEAAAAVLLGWPERIEPACPAILGAGTATETIGEDGTGSSDYAAMTAAMRGALQSVAMPVALTMTDWNNGRFRGAEGGYAALRLTRRFDPDADTIHLPMLFGDVGAASQSLALAGLISASATDRATLITAAARLSGLRSAIACGSFYQTRSVAAETGWNIEAIE